jgi:hypothetical protein
MNVLSAGTRYILWHYTSAFLEILFIWRNLFLFFVHFFSISLLLMTLFSPWKRMEERGRQADVEGVAGAIAVGLVSRIVGALVRLFIIFFGLMCLLAMFVGLLLFLLLWIVLPVLSVLLVLIGAYLILFRSV